MVQHVHVHTKKIDKPWQQKTCAAASPAGTHHCIKKKTSWIWEEMRVGFG
jgi:hypothetical protein